MASSPVLLRSGCKINLYLHVGAKLTNGYHNIDSLLLPLPEPHDIIQARILDKDGSGSCRVRFFANADVGIPLPDISPENNTLTRAYALFAGLTGFAPALELCVRKGVPHGAGLGGGSANAGAMLLWLYAAAKKNGILTSFDQLLEASASVGADVPFFLFGKPAQAAGIGEQLRPAPNPFQGHFLVLVCPSERVSTGWAFAALDSQREKKKAESFLTSPAAQANKSLAHASGSCNDFEPVVFAAYPQLDRLHRRLLQTETVLARMSGTGSACFAIYRDEKNARDVAKTLAKEGMAVYMSQLPIE